MKDQIKLLVELQQLDASLIRKNDVIRSIPGKISSQEQRLAIAQAEYGREKQKCEAAEKKKKDKDHALEELNDRIKKLKARTSEIKNNKEYQAHLKEIESTDKERSGIEDDILRLMESVDSAQRALKAVEARFNAEKEKTEAFRKELQEEVGAAQGEVTKLKASRDAFVKGIGREFYDLYFMLLKSKRGLAVAEARDEICQGCNMNIPPQLFVELKKCERVIQCPQCNRILYWKEESADLSPEV